MQSDLLSTLVQELEKTDEKSLAQIRNLRDSFSSGLKNGFTSHRGLKENSLVHSFIEFDEFNLARFDFMANEVKLPETITAEMNLEQVDNEVLWVRVQELESKVCGRR